MGSKRTGGATSKFRSLHSTDASGGVASSFLRSFWSQPEKDVSSTQNRRHVPAVGSTKAAGIHRGPQAPASSLHRSKFSDQGTGTGATLSPILHLLFAFWLGAVALAFFLYSEQVSGVASLLRRLDNTFGSPKSFQSQIQFQELATRLAQNSTIVLLVFNSGFLDFFHNWALHAEEVGLGGHFVAVLEDELSFQYVSKHWPGQAARVHVPELEADNAEALSHEGLQYLAHPSRRRGRATEMDAPEFRMMMYRRLFYVRVLLKANLNVLLCDVDIILLKNPMPHFTRNFELYGVMEIQEDIHGKDTETVQLERGSAMYLNAGFLFFRAHHRTLLLLDFWLLKIFRAERKLGYENDQIFLRFAIINLSILDWAPRIAVVPQQLFPPGWLYFGSAKWRESHKGEVVVVHNNWIRTKECKLLRLLQHGLWRLPGLAGVAPTVTLVTNRDSDSLKAVGIRGVNWTFTGVRGSQLPWNASQCRVGTGVVRPSELKQWQ